MRPAAWSTVLLVACGSRPPSLPALPPAAPPTRPAVAGAPRDAAPEPAVDEHALPAAPPSGVDWGTEHPTFLIAADESRRWMAICQARSDTNGDGTIGVHVGAQGELEGDRLGAYLMVGPGPGERIDAFAGSDPTGRFVAFVVDDHLWLWDAHTNERRDLSRGGASTTDDQTSYGSHRAVAFDPAGTRALTFRPEGDKELIVIHGLLDGGETVVDPGEGLIWRAAFDARSESIVAQVVTEDTNRNRRLDWPVPMATTPMQRCLATPPRFAVWDRPGDRAEPRRIPLPDGPPEDAPAHLIRLAEASVERDPDGSLHWRTPDGTRHLLAKEECEGRIVHADAERSLVITTCRDKKTRRHRLWLRGMGYAKDLELEMVTVGADFWLDGSPPLVPIHAGRDSALVDMVEREVIRLRDGDRVAATRGEHALVVRGDSLVVRGPAQAELPLGIEMSAYGRTLTSGRFVAALPWVIDLEGATAVGRFDESPLALSSDGLGLLPARPARGGQAPMGPLRWIAPGPLPAGRDDP